MKVLVSSCLIGKKCSYDGRDRLSVEVLKLCTEHGYVDVCPELLGGLLVPRERHEVKNGSGANVLDGRGAVISETGKDMTNEFLKSSFTARAAAESAGISVAILKSKSPSCGKGRIYDGTFSGRLVDGNGVTAEALIRAGLKVFTENEISLAMDVLDAA